MLTTISDFFIRISSARTAAAALIICLVFITLVLPNFKMPGGQVMPDKLFYYTADELAHMADTYGKEGRSAYVTVSLTYDLAWPLVYLGFLFITISYFTRLTLPPEHKFKALNLFPMLPALFDALENSSLCAVMVSFPDTPGILHWPGLFTAGKWISVTACFLVLGVLMIYAGWRNLNPPN